MRAISARFWKRCRCSREWEAARGYLRAAASACLYDGKDTLMSAELKPMPQPQDTAFVEFWNTVLAPKFIRFRHILVGGLTLHSEAVFPTLPVQRGDRALDVGCGFGDTAMKLARLVGPD